MPNDQISTEDAAGSSAELPYGIVEAGQSVERIKDLFEEVNAMANQLRKGLDEGDAVLAGGRSILRILDAEGPLTVPELGRVRSTSRQNIQVLVNRLAADGCVELTSNPAHKRSALIRITEQGRAAHRALVADETKLLERLLPQVSEAEVVSAAESLRHLRGLLAKPQAPSERRDEPGDRKRRAETSGMVKQAAENNGSVLVGTRKTTPIPAERLPASEASEEDFPVNLL